MKQLTAKQAAEILGVSKRRFNAFVDEGRIKPSATVAQTNLFRPSDVEKLKGRPAAGRPKKVKS